MAIEGGTLGLFAKMMEPMFDRVFVAGEERAIWWVGGAVLGIFLLRAVSSFAQRMILTRVRERVGGRAARRSAGAPDAARLAAGTRRTRRAR